MLCGLRMANPIEAYDELIRKIIDEAVHELLMHLFEQIYEHCDGYDQDMILLTELEEIATSVLEDIEIQLVYKDVKLH